MRAINKTKFYVLTHLNYYKPYARECQY